MPRITEAERQQRVAKSGAGLQKPPTVEMKTIDQKTKRHTEYQPDPVLVQENIIELVGKCYSYSYSCREEGERKSAARPACV